jgi:hypothetical protein
MRGLILRPNVGLNFGWVCTLDWEKTIHMTNTTPRMEQSEDTIQTHPITRITKTISRCVHGVVVP